MAQAFAKRLSPNLVAEQGTDVGKALELAMLSFSSQSERSRVIVLITDGENHEADAVAVARKAAEMGIRIYTIGIGTPEGAPIEIDGEFVKDENDEMVVSKLNEKMLEEIASLTEAAYVRASKQSIGLEEIVKSINEMERSELTTVKYEEYNEQYQYLVAVALALLLMDILVLSRRNPRLRRFNIFRE
jgi:Ca-activated chloride channel family protein